MSYSSSKLTAAVFGPHNGLMTINPLEHDTQTAELYEQAAKIQRDIEAHRDRMHRMAGDRKGWEHNHQLWNMTLAQVDDQLRTRVLLGDSHDPRHGMKPSEAMTRDHELGTEMAKVMLQIEAMEKVYREHRWTRYFPCLNPDGHIHSSFRSCPTVNWNTAMAWYPQLSGKTVEEAVAELGPALCSVCFPLAPVEHKSMTLGQVEKERTRDEREAAKAARQAAKAAKTLTPAQQFRNHHGWKVETVAAAKQALRDERELFYYYGRGPHPWHPEAVEAAATAKAVLLAREDDQPGTGATAAEIEQIVVRADKKYRTATGD